MASESLGFIPLFFRICEELALAATLPAYCDFMRLYGDFVRRYVLPVERLLTKFISRCFRASSPHSRSEV